tara:strand:+ start:1232 stop:1435 length:204 start_codon:yes stop_codon:yes gene_type:complete
MELDDPFDSLEIPVLQNFVTNGWNDWIIERYNPDQLELFDTYEFQKYDRFGRLIDKANQHKEFVISR